MVSPRRPLHVAIGTALVATAALGSCAEPTAVVVEVFTDLPCGARPLVVVIGGSRLDELAERVPSTTASTCAEGTGRVGSVVVLPSDGDADGMAFVVATRLDGQVPDECGRKAPPKGCIAARRQIKFIRHTALRMRIDLRASCADVSCPGDQTCVLGACVPALVGDCSSGCTESGLLPPGVPASGPPYWLKGAPMPTPRRYAGGALAGDGRIYVVGGGEPGPRTSLATNESYDALADRWAPAPVMPIANSAMAFAAGLDGRLYLFGGGAALREAHRFEPATGQWITIRPLPTGRMVTRAVTGTDGLIYVLGGDDFAGRADLPTVEAFDPTGGTWQAMPPMPTGRGTFGAALGSDGRIHAFGGDNVTTTGRAFDTAEAYDTGARAWSTLPSMPVAVSGLNAAGGPDGRIYVSGGSFLGAYSVERRTWDRIVPQARPRAVPVVVRGPDDRVYVIGGGTATEPTATVEAYGPVIGGVPPTASPGARFTLTGANFGAFAGVTVYLDRVGGQVLATGRTDVTGTVAPPIEVTLPAAASGPHAIVVEDDRARFPVKRPTSL